MEFVLKTEIKTPDSFDGNKTISIENIISSHFYLCLIFLPIETELILKTFDSSLSVIDLFQKMS